MEIGYWILSYGKIDQQNTILKGTEMEYTGKYKKMAEQFRKDGCDEHTVENYMDKLKEGAITIDDFSDDLKDTIGQFTGN